MGQASNIEWTDSTWNPVRGCSRVSPGCVNCYAEKVAARFSGPGLPYEGLARINTIPRKAPEPFRTEARWTGAVRVVPEHMADPLRWTRARRVFVNSMSDLFHEKLSNEDIAAVFGVMAAAPLHTFQVLTKRADRMRDWFAWAAAAGGLPKWIRANWPMIAARFSDGSRFMEVNGKPVRRGDDAGAMVLNAAGVQVWPLSNVWLGVSVEDQQRADERIPLLLQTPAAVRFVSYEPALGAVDFAPFMWPVHDRWPSPFNTPEEARAAGAVVTRHRQALVLKGSTFLDWVIVGGESGPGARPFDVAWARSVVEQCKAAGVACFVKQLGAKPHTETTIARPLSGTSWPADTLLERDAEGGPIFLRLRDKKGGDMSEWSEDLRVREFPEAAS